MYLKSIFTAMIQIVSTKYFTIWVHLCTKTLIQSTRWTPVTSCLVNQTISTTSWNANMWYFSIHLHTCSDTYLKEEKITYKYRSTEYVSWCYVWRSKNSHHSNTHHNVFRKICRRTLYTVLALVKFVLEIHLLWIFLL